MKEEHTRKLLSKPLMPTDLVFSRPDGRLPRPNTVSRAFQEIARSVGLKGVRLHDLRHAHAAISLQQGVHPKEEGLQSASPQLQAAAVLENDVGKMLAKLH